MTTAITITLGIVFTVSALKSLRRASDWHEYSTGVRSGQYISPWLAAISIFASFAGGFMFFGVPQLGAEGGLSAYALGLSYVIGLPIVLWISNRVKNRVDLRDGYFGIDILIRKSFGPSSQFAAYVLCILVFLGVLGAQLLAVGYYLRIYTGHLDYLVVLGLGVGATFLYTLRGGFKAVLSNDYLQGVMEFSVCIILLVGVYYFVSNDVSTVNFSPLSDGIGGKHGPIYPIVGAISIGLTFVARPDLWQRVRLVEERKISSCLWIASIAIFFFYALMATVGVLVKSNPETFSSLDGFPLGEMPIRLAGLTLSLPFQIIVLSGILLGLMSSIDAYLNLVSVLMAKVVLWQKYEDCNDVLMANAKIAAFGAMIVAVMLAVVFPDIVELLSASFSIFGVIVPIVILTVFGKTARYPDWVGAIPLWLSLAVLVVSFPFLRSTSFVPAIAVGWIALASALIINRWLLSRQRNSSF